MKQILLYPAALLVLGYLAYAYVSTKPKSTAIKTSTTQPISKPITKPPAACNGPSVTHTQINDFVFSWQISGVNEVEINPGQRKLPSSASLTLVDGDELTLSAACGGNKVEIKASRHGNATNVTTNSSG